MTNIVKSELDNIVDRISKTVKAEEIYLFGSYAEGKEKEDSDFDLYVVLDRDEERPIKAIQKIRFALSTLDIRSVDILANYQDVFITSIKTPTLEKRIYEKGVKLYDRKGLYI